MIATTKYNVGDIVWYNHGFSYSFEVTCTACTATGRVTLNNGIIIKCGECSGSGNHRVDRPYKIRPQKGTVTEVQTSTKSGIKYIISTYPYAKTESELFETFFKSRQEAHNNNIRHGWPKKDFDRWEDGGYFATSTYPNRCYWGVRLRKDLTSRNIEDAE